MSRRRAQKEQEKEDFLDQNPHLIEFKTEYDVVKDDGSFDNNFSVVGSQNDGPEFTLLPFNHPIEDSAEATIVQLLDGPDINFYNEDGISLSDAGIGVGLNSDEPGFDKIESSETLGFEVFDENFRYPGAEPSPTDVNPFGFESLELEFIATGRGTVELEAFSDYWGRADAFQSGYVRGDGETVYAFEVEQPSFYTYNYGEIGTTGTLAISLVGINVVTNFESGFDPFSLVP